MLLHRRLDEAMEHDFFTWFHLEEVGRGPAPGGGTFVAFKPEGDRFRPLVTVWVFLDGSRSIEGMEMHLLRSFIDHKMDALMARDIGKSLLYAAVPEADMPSVEPLARQLQHVLPKGPQVVLMPVSAVPHDLPQALQVGFEVFEGKRRSCELDMRHCKLRLENLERDGHEGLLMSVRAPATVSAGDDLDAPTEPESIFDLDAPTELEVIFPSPRPFSGDNTGGRDAPTEFEMHPADSPTEFEMVPRADPIVGRPDERTAPEPKKAPMTDHAGQRWSGDWNLFAPPPPEIGSITSAGSSLRQGQWPESPAVWGGRAAGILAAGAATGAIAGAILFPHAPTRMELLAAVFASAGALVSVFTSRSYCSFVGERGIAWATARTFPEALQVDKLEFRQASRLVAEAGPIAFKYVWIGADGSVAFRVEGSGDTDAARHRRQFGQAAEFAWTMYCADKVNTREALAFPVLQWDGAAYRATDDFTRVGPGFVEMRLAGQTHRWGASHVPTLKVAPSGLTPRGGAQVYVPWSHLADTRLFLVLLKLLGGFSLE